MKLMHLGDLHIGKRVSGFSMLEDQKHILGQILAAVEAEKPDAVLVAGDVYDRSIPSEEAVKVADDFFVRLSKTGTRVLVISGNHDSAERVAFGGRLMEASGVHFAPVFRHDGDIVPVHLTDEHGTVTVWPIPFLKPADVREAYPEEREDIHDYTDAMRTVIARLAIDTAGRNVAIAHQFITGASTCDSEEKSIGGLDDISADVFDAFDYVALGHLHGPQRVGRDTIRYAGSPLKYSFSELNQKKGITMVELGAKDDVTIRMLPLKPLHEWERLKGSFVELMARPETDAYVECIITDEEETHQALDRLRGRYPNLMGIRYDNARTRSEVTATGAESVEKKTDLELFAELFEKQNGRPMSETERAYVSAFLTEDAGDGEEADA